MFRNTYQSGLLSILYSCGSAPLEYWGMQVKNGYIRRIVDEEVKSLALEIAGTNVSTTFIYAPKNKKTVLAITLPFLIMVIKNMKKYFTFEITILDDKRMHRRFRISNFQSSTIVRPFCTTMPIGLGDGWHQIQFNLADFTTRAYQSNYVETTRMQIHANCRIRRIYFADRLYAEDDLPEEYKLLYPPPQDPCVKEKKRQSRTSLAARSLAKVPVEAVPPDEPPPFRADSRISHEETERRTTPVPSADPSAEPSRLVAPEGASKVRLEIDEEQGRVQSQNEIEPQSEEDEQEDEEQEEESQVEADDEAITEPEDLPEDNDEEQSTQFSALEEQQEQEQQTDVEDSEGEEESGEAQIS